MSRKESLDALRKKIDHVDAKTRTELPFGTAHEDLLVPIFRNGKLVYNAPPLASIRATPIRTTTSA